MLPTQTLLDAIPHCLTTTDLPLPNAKKYTGKVRDTYDLTPENENGQLLLLTTDRQSGFDRLLGAIPFKGQVLNRTSLFWFEATKHLVPNHVLASPHANALLARKCRVLPIEFVVRGYLTGSTDTSIWTKYQAGERTFPTRLTAARLTLPEGMRKNQPLPTHLITPTTKEAAHDRPITPAEIISEGWLTPDQWDFCAEAALKLFQFGQDLAQQRGLILVDTKYEFGLDPDGQIRLIDEIHTPDSSRYWIADTYSTAPKRKPRTRHDRQRVLPPLVPPTLRPLQRRHSPHPTPRTHCRTRQPLHPAFRKHHRRTLHPRPPPPGLKPSLQS